MFPLQKRTHAAPHGTLLLSWSIQNKKIECTFQASTHSGAVINEFHLQQDLFDEESMADRLSEFLFIHYPQPENCFFNLTIKGFFKHGPFGDIEEFMTYEQLPLTQNQIRTYLNSEIDTMVQSYKLHYLRSAQLNQINNRHVI